MDPYVGEIRVFGGNFAPAGWALCNGQLIAISQNNALFALIGTTYGGDGQNTFALPNLQSRVLVHQGTDPTGNAYVQGQTGGGESVTLSLGQLPPHTHGVVGNSLAGTTGVPGPTVTMAMTVTGENVYDNNTANQTSLAGQAIGNAGGNLPHDNRQPFLAVTYIISLFGIFPSRN
jgi:microcystin-dependent protein